MSAPPPPPRPEERKCEPSYLPASVICGVTSFGGGPGPFCCDCGRATLATGPTACGFQVTKPSLATLNSGKYEGTSKATLWTSATTSQRKVSPPLMSVVFGRNSLPGP